MMETEQRILESERAEFVWTKETRMEEVQTFKCK